MNYYSWFDKLTTSLAIYHSYVKRINNVVTAYKVTPLKRVQDLQFILVYMADALEEAERHFLETEFPKPTGEYCTKTEWVSAMGIDFLVFKN